MQTYTIKLYHHEALGLGEVVVAAADAAAGTAGDVLVIAGMAGMAGTAEASGVVFSKCICNALSVDFDLNKAYVDFLSSSVDLDFLKSARRSRSFGSLRLPVDFLKERRTLNHVNSRFLFALPAFE
jgi:hypothetical protein